MCALMAVMAVVAAAMSIWISALGCKVACCGTPSDTARTGVCLKSALCYVWHAVLSELIAVLHQFSGDKIHDYH